MKLVRLGVVMVGLAAAAAAAVAPNRPWTPAAAPCNLTGTWKDPRHPTTFAATEDDSGSWQVQGPWKGTPGGRVLPNLTLWLQFPGGPLSTGQVDPACDGIVWTDQPDKAAHNTWCRVGSPACASPPPTPPGPPAPAHVYPPLWGGGFSPSADAPASPDPLVAYRWNSSALESLAFQTYTRQPRAVLGSVPTGVTGAETLLNTSASPGDLVFSSAATIAFDFGVECAGWLELTSPDLGASLAANEATILLSSSEYTRPGYTTPTGASNNNGNCTMAPQRVDNSTYRLVLNPEYYEGLRYGWIHVTTLAPGAKVTITAFTAVCQILPINYVDDAFVALGPLAPPGSATTTGAGAFELARVWYSALYTTRVDLLAGGSFGSILMDRGDRISWTGDAHLAQKAALAGFGDAFGAGLVRANTERTKGVDNGIITYDLYFVLSAVDYFLHTGDVTTFVGWGPVIEAKFGTAVKFWATPSTQSFCGSDDRIGADFERTPPSEAEKTRYYKMLSVQAALAYASAVALCPACPGPMKTAAAGLNSTFAAHFDSERGALNQSYGMHAAAGAIATGLTTIEEEEWIFTHLLSNPAHICSFSPFNTYFILETLGRVRLPGGRVQSMRAALDMVRRCYHGMIRLGATTFWETFSPEWNSLYEFGASTPNGQTGYMSHAHPWASGAAPWMTHTVVGIQTLGPGFASFRVQPFLDPAAPNYLTSIAGAQPVLSGDAVRVSSGCDGHTTLHVPANTTAVEVILPLCGQAPAKLTVNGQSETFAQVPDGDGVRVGRALTAGDYTLVLTFTPSPPPPPPPPPAVATYNYRYVGMDCSHGGAWVGRWGSKGHALFNFDKSGSNVETLPPGVRSIVFAGHNTGAPSCPGCTATNWITPSSCSPDPRALQPPPASNTTHPSPRLSVRRYRSAGVVGTKGHAGFSTPSVEESAKRDGRASGGARAAGQCRGLGGVLAPTTVTIDLLAPPGSSTDGPPLNVTLYLVDYERFGREMALETREYSNLQLGAPTQRVQDFGDGCMVTFELTPPARFRLMQVVTELPYSNAGVAVSALFFD